MDCYLCNESVDTNVPLLKCNHFLHPKCYCKLKDNKINNCLLCNQKLIRGRKKNKLN